MYKIIFESKEQLNTEVEEQLDKTKSDMVSLLEELPISNDYDKEFINERIHHAFEFFSEIALYTHVYHARSFWNITIIPDMGQRFVVLSMLNAIMQFTTSMLFHPTDNKDEYLHRYFYYSYILQYLNVIAKLLLRKRYVIEFNAYHIPISLATLQHNEKIAMLQSEIDYLYSENKNKV